MDSNDLKVSLIQDMLHWENPTANLNDISTKLVKLYGATDLVVLPEMFTTGFSMNPQGLASGDEILDYLKDHAARGNYAIYGSVMFYTGEFYVNRGIFMRPDATFELYDKRHTFTLAGEHEVYHQGGQPVTTSYKGWKFLLQICYDLRFPVYSRNTQDYDVALYVANWPVPRVNAWDALLKARAIENMSYVVGVNRIGKDGTGMDYSGHSQVYDVLGNAMLEHPWITAGIQEVKLSKKGLNNYRGKLRFLEDRDAFSLHEVYSTDQNS
ncbi:amidohydrolase [Nonlabens xiamenensis]|uniref:amidohydrolase n=1 Tax=Nonlabens xiamenensis TaxID=2341043 RepID=UPI000F615D3F|nr:amidohydrolase [Nonlabens xiamenensis]